MPSLPAKPVSALMRENAALKSVQDRCAALSRLQQSFADALPPGLSDSCRVAALEGSTLVIAAANGAAAARLKQMLPRVLQSLRDAETAVPASPSATQSGKNKIKEQQVTAISVLVQPNFRELSPPRASHAGRVAMPADKRAELVEQLGTSPLKESLQRRQKTRERGLT